MNLTSTQFKDLNVGDEFDFISPNAMMNSFYARCRKISARKYRDEKRQVYSVGSGKCEVYNVERKKD